MITLRRVLHPLKSETCNLHGEDFVVNCLCVSYTAGSNVSAYVGMVNEVLKTTIPKAVVHCQVREAKRSLLDTFYTRIGQFEVRGF